jgi:hypothetical protein
MTFEKDIAELVDTHLTRRTRLRSIAPLASALGCRNAKLTTGLGWIDLPVCPVTPEHEPLVRQTLLLALRSHVSEMVDVHYADVFAIIDGLLKHGRWLDCLFDMESTHCLAVALVRLSMNEPDLVLVRQGLEPALTEMLNSWLKPATSFSSYPSTEALAKAMFGAAWYEFVIEGPARSLYVVGDIIKDTRPEFLPGLAPSQSISVEEVLPTMEGS